MKTAIKLDVLTARRAVRLIAPQTPDQLHAYIRIVLGFDIPRRPLVTGHSPPTACGRTFRTIRVFATRLLRGSSTP